MEVWIDKLLDAAILEGLLDREQKPVARYGLVVVCHTLASAVAIVALGYILGVWELALTAAATWGLLRFVSGGAHIYV